MSVQNTQHFAGWSWLLEVLVLFAAAVRGRALFVPNSDDAVDNDKGTTKELVVVPPSEVVRRLPGCQNQQSRSCSYHVWSRYVHLLLYLDGANCQLLTKCMTSWRWPLTFSSLRLASLHKIVNCLAVFLTSIRSQYWFHTCIDYANSLIHGFTNKLQRVQTSVARLVLPNLSQQPATALLCEPPVNSRIIFKFSHTNYSPVTTGQPAYLCTLLHHDTLRSTNQFFPRCTSIFRWIWWKIV